jgi:GntR family transcriptional regulator, transcriptional repressor for pyruvate dehydrogenase complex
MTGGGWVGLPRGGVARGCALGPGPGDATLGDRLYAQILERILGGEFMPDTRLPSEAQLASRFAVSRPIVREVLARLRDHGYVASRRGSGSYVRWPPNRVEPRFVPLGSLADLQRCLEFRTAFEGRAAALAAERHDVRSLGAIEAALKALEESLRDGLPGVDADIEFHRAVALATRNHFFMTTFGMLESQIRFGMNLARNLSLNDPIERLRSMVSEHERILDAIRRRDRAEAEQAMVEHIANAQRRLFEGEAAPGGVEA